MSLQRRTLIETTTSLSPSQVLDAAREFFTRRNSIYATFVEQESDSHVSLRGQGGEEIVVAVSPSGPNTRVSGASYMFDAQVSRFFSILPTATDVAGIS